MKTFIGVVLLVIVMGVIVQMRSTDSVYVREESTVEVQQEEPKEAWMLDEQAIQAAKDVVKKKELQAELEKLDIEIKEKQEKRKQITDELTTY